MSRESRFGVRSTLLPVTLGCLVLGSLAGTSQAGPVTPATSKLEGAMAGRPYTVTIAKVSAKKGQPATAQVVITAAAGYHLNTDYPTALKLSPPAGVTATAARLEIDKSSAPAAAKSGSLAVTLASSEAGQKKVPGELRFAVCTDTTCDPQRSAVTIDLEVK